MRAPGAALAAAAAAAAACPRAARAAAPPRPNPPEWPPSVRVFGPEDSTEDIESAVGRAYGKNGGHAPIDHGQFSEERYAFFFKPGTYAAEVPVGYYTQVLGLGASPSDVVFSSERGVFAEEGDQTDLGGALSTFWRAAENFRIQGSMMWAVSQAAPLRRIIVDKDLSLSQYVDGVGCGYASGGFLANARVSGTIHSASQQQWFTRNTLMGGWPEGNWNMVFVGNKNGPASKCGRKDGEAGFPSVAVDATPIIAEKPFITIDPDGKYSLQIPSVRHDSVGPNFDDPESKFTVVDFADVYVATDVDSADVINEQLSSGLHVVLTPGIYRLRAPLKLSHEGQVLLGLGLATLVSAAGNPVVCVGNVDGVRIAGLLLEAGPDEAETLLEWGDGSHEGSAENPGVLTDLFARVGGPNDPAQGEVRAKVMVKNGGGSSGHVVGDNLWLWRADHGVAGKVTGAANPCENGLVVKGNHVTMYGLAVEHTLKDLAHWFGDDGQTFFYQSELPYDVDESWGDAGFVGYRVDDGVKHHKAYGVGVYHYFRDHAVTVQTGIAAPSHLESSFVSPLAVSLSGKGTMLAVMNCRGDSTSGDAGVSYYCETGTPTVACVPGRAPAPTPAPPPTDAPPPTAMPPTAAPGPPGECAEPWEKCGGQGWTGPTCCTEKYTCVEFTRTTSQCLPRNPGVLIDDLQLNDSAVMDDRTAGVIELLPEEARPAARGTEHAIVASFQLLAKLPWWAFLLLVAQVALLCGVGCRVLQRRFRAGLARIANLLGLTGLVAHRVAGV
ncbi:unnamed protein product [Prorocentrum cordatum]|uniref:CBM1 domain-containing protein n=1 Tax=Prorocentrum cordatum TaxID=2364126 RepID=A0ABN9Y460_9DINO|nr:unnamed protein product [Polarella glacialis]